MGQKKLDFNKQISGIKTKKHQPFDWCFAGNKIYVSYFYSKLPSRISNILMAASLIFVAGPKTATAPASNKNW